MRTIEIRRHCFTKKSEERGQGSHLSQEGVSQARRIGTESGPFDRVITSSIPRTLETALAMGFAVDAIQEELGHISLDVWNEIGHQERWEWENPFAHFAAIIARGGATAALGRAQQAIWATAVESLGPDGRVLIVSHGRVIESGLVTCFPAADFAAWRHPFHHGEGVRMDYVEGIFQNLRILRDGARSA